MSNTDIKIKLRRDTTANWQSVNPVLLQGEVGLEYNAAMDEVIGIKIGDGNTAWNDLEYVIGSKVPTGIDFDNLANNVHTDDTLTVKDNKLAINVDNSTYADGTALTWNPDTNEFVYKPVASSGGGFKNLIINGDFQVWQRGKSFTINNDSMYTADRWMVDTQSSGILVNGEIDSSQSTVDLCDPFGDGSGIALYKFDGNADDVSGNYNGTWHGTEQYDTGVFGQAAKFDGSSYVDVGNTLTDGFTAMSISLWFNTIQLTHYGHLISKQGSTISWIIQQGGDNPVYSFSIWEGNTAYSVTTPTINLNQWYHLVVTWDGTIIHLYLNGQESGSKNFTGNMNSTSSSVLIGALNDGSVRDLYQGLIDQVRIFNRALTQEEIDELYHEDYQVISNNGATHRLTSTPDYSTEYVKPFVYRFEGRHLYNQAVQGKKLTLSFDFKSTRTGNYSVALINKTDNSNIQSRIATFSYTTAGNMKRYAITFDLSEFTTPVNNDNQLGFELVLFGMSDDMNLIGQDGIMETGEKITTATTVRLEKDDQLWIDRVQLEEGENATEFVPLVPQLSHLMSRRYYQIKADSDSTTLFPLMRTDNPTVTGSGPYVFDAEIY